MHRSQVELAAVPEGDWFVFTWRCTRCGAVVHDSKVHTSISLGDLETLERLDVELLDAVAHVCA